MCPPPTIVIENDPQPIQMIVRYHVHNKCLLCQGNSFIWLLRFSQVREALQRINPHPSHKPSGFRLRLHPAWDTFPRL